MLYIWCAEMIQNRKNKMVVVTVKFILIFWELNWETGWFKNMYIIDDTCLLNGNPDQVSSKTYSKILYYLFYCEVFQLLKKGQAVKV